MGLLNREQIFSISDIEYEDVEVPEWGGTVRVKSLTGAERDEFEKSIVDFKPSGKSQRASMNLSNIRAKLVVMAVCDVDGNRIFRDVDAKRLGEKSAAVLDRLFSVAQRLSGLTDEDVEELERNLEEAQNEDSTSD